MNNAQLICNAGGSPSIFKVTSNIGYQIQNLTVGLSSDKVGGKNIFPFGSCAFKKSGCQCPDISGEWTDQATSLTVNGQNILTMSSTIKCKTGGVVTVQKNSTEIIDKAVMK